MAKLTKRRIDEAQPGSSQQFIWDEELRGFGVRITPNGIKTFVFQYRTKAGRTRRLTLGRYGALTVDQAREMARQSAHAHYSGKDPMREQQAKRKEPTVSEVLDRYIADHIKLRCAPSTQSDQIALVEKHLRPRLGSIKISDLTSAEVAKMHNGMKDTPRRANYAIACLSKAMELAEQWGLRPAHSNPCRKIDRFSQEHRTRFLRAEEIERLGQALTEAETIGIPWRTSKQNTETGKHLAKPENQRAKIAWQCIAVLRLLLLTGARLSEIKDLKWTDIDATGKTFALPDRKGGRRRAHPVPDAVLEMIKTFPKKEGTAFVFPRDSDPQKPISAEVMENAWGRIRWRAGIDDVRIHDLRHTVGTFAAQAGVSGFIVKDLMRHTNMNTTARYTNFDAEPVREVSNAVAERILKSLIRKHGY